MKNLFLLLLLFLSFSMYGQWTYTTSYYPDMGNPDGLNTESDATSTSWNVIHPGSAQANAWSATTPIPFPFNFYGMPVTDFVASYNGVVTFNTAAPGTAPGPNTNLPAMGLPDMSVCGFWDEFTSSAPTGTNDQVLTKVFGTTPNRQFWIKWFSFEMGNPSASFNYFSIVLEETTDNIYLVDLYGTSSPALTTTGGVQLNSTTAVQVGTDQLPLNGNGSLNPDNDYYLFEATPLFNDDAGITAIVNPTIPLSTGMQNVDVELTNIGINNLNSVDIQWEIDGTLQTPFNWTAGPLTPNGTAVLTLGTYNFPTGFTSLKAWTEMPNGTADSYVLNDTSEVLLCTAISGTFTVGGAGADFADLTAAVDALGCGISGPVVFNVNPGIYNESIKITEVAGASATNTITFDGGSAATTSILWSTGLGGNAVIQLDGADYVNIQNFTIEHPGSTDAWGVFVWHEADYNTISDCIFNMDPATGVFDVASVVAANDLANDSSEGDNGDYLTVQNCVFNGGEMGIHLEGLGLNAADFTNGVKILNNVFDSQDDYAIYLDNMDSIEVMGNKIFGLKSAFADGIYSFDIMNFKINANDINVPDWGIYISDGNFDAAPTILGEIMNNMVSSETDYAMYFVDLQFTRIIHNSAYGLPAIQIGSNMDGLEVINNIFASDADYVFETTTQMGISKMDHNLFYAPPSNQLFAKYGTATFPTLAAWQAAFPAINANSITGDPMFKSIVPGNNDLHVIGILANDIADAGTGVLVDIDGEARPFAPSTVPDIGADEYSPPANDVGASAIANPTPPLSTGLQNVDVEVSNLGINTVTSVTVQWMINNVLQAPYSWTGSLNSSASVVATVGTYNFPTGFTTIKAWTEMPNGVMDSDFTNDTTEVTLCTAISGTYTVGGAGADFPDMTSAVSALECGISAPVVFNVNPGTYFEPLIIQEVAGASATNTVTFDGGSANTTSLGYDSALGENAVIQLDGADHIIFKNFTIDNKGTTDAWGVFLWHQADHNTISDCIFVMDPGQNAIDVVAIVASNNIDDDISEGDNCNYLTVENCVINGGEMGIHLEALGLNATDFANGNRIINNVFSNVEDYGIYLDNQDSIEIIGNTIEGLRSTFADGIYSFDIMNFKINENTINAPDWGIYVSDGNFDAAPTQVGELINNMISSETDYAVYFLDVQFTKILHNTLYGRPAIQLGGVPDGLEIINNIFASETDFAFETTTQTGFNKVNYNLYYTPSTNANFVKFGTSLFANLGAWQAASPALNINSVTGDPKFVSTTPSSFDLHVTGVTANDIADPSVGITVDIDGDTRPLAPSTVPDIGADEYLPTAFDASTIALISPVGGICGSATIPVEAEIFNLGVATITTMDVHVSVTGTITSNFTYNFAGSIPSNQSQSLVLGNINVPNGGNVDVTIVSDLAGDLNTVNDTLQKSILVVSPNPATSPNQTVCSGSIATLIPNFEPGVTYGWFDAPGGNLLAVDTFVTPPLTNNTTYYLTHILYENDSITTAFAGGNGCGGGNMFNITNIGTTAYEIDAVDLNFSTVGTATANFHYIPNGTYLGNETNAGAWTALTSETVNVAASGAPTYVPLSTTLTIPAGATYAFYAEYAANYTNGTTTISNGIFSLDLGAGLCSAFGGVNPGRLWNGSLYYKVIDLSGVGVCNSTITPVMVTINPNGPVINLGPDEKVCTGESFVLDAGVPGLTYVWSTGETTQTIMNTAPGTYWVEVYDPTCGTTPITDTIEITNYPNIAGNPSLITDASCAGNDGAIDMLIIGGTPPYTYLWSDGQVTEDASGLAPGTYTTSVTDANGCTYVSFGITVNAAPDAINVTEMSTNVSCNGASDGSIDITPTGGTPPFTYTWSNGATTEDLSGLSGGTYSVSITDPNGCFSSITATITEAPALAEVGSATDETMVGANDGTITITSVTGGIPPYTISWATGQTTFGISNLPPGNYIGVITDSVGCVLNVDYTVNPGLSGLVEMNELISVNLFPNPTQGEAVLSFTLTERKDVVVKVVNALGQELKVIELPNTISEEVDLNLESLASGTYFVKLGIDGNFITKKISLINN